MTALLGLSKIKSQTVKEVFHYKVKKKIELTEDICKIILTPKDEALYFIPGQYTQIVLSQKIRCPFSIANLPNKEGIIELHIRHRKEDTLIKNILKHIDDNEFITLSKAQGNTILPEKNKDKKIKLLFVIGGTGFSQGISLINDAIQKDLAEEISVFWGARILNDLYAHKECLELKEKNLIKYYPILSQDKVQGFLHNLVCSAVIESDLELPNYYIYSSGPFGMLEDFKRKIKIKYPNNQNIIIHSDLR